MWRLRARPMDLGDDDEVRGKVSGECVRVDVRYR